MRTNNSGKQKGQPRKTDLSGYLNEHDRSTGEGRAGDKSVGARKPSEQSQLSLLEPYVIYKSEESGEWRIRCPFHFDVAGDCSVNVRNGKFHCFACEQSGTTSGLFTYLRGQPEPPWLSEPLRGGTPSSSRSPVPSGPPSAGAVAGWHRALLNDPERLAYLMGPKRMLTLETIKRFEIGWNRGFKCYPIPIYDNTGQLYSLMKYRPNGDPKMLYRRGDHASLFPWAVLRTVKRGDLLIVCEGHWDAMLLNQLGVPAVTGGGASIWRDLWSVVLRRIGVRVVVIYDCDESGREGRRKPLRGIPGSRAIDLGPSRDDGYDVTDYLGTHLVDELLAVIR